MSLVHGLGQVPGPAPPWPAGEVAGGSRRWQEAARGGRRQQSRNFISPNERKLTRVACEQRLASPRLASPRLASPWLGLHCHLDLIKCSQLAPLRLAAFFCFNCNEIKTLCILRCIRFMIAICYLSHSCPALRCQFQFSIFNCREIYAFRLLH